MTPPRGKALVGRSAGTDQGDPWDRYRDEADTALTALADPQRAEGMRAYMRDRFEFLGVPTPARREAVRSALKALATAPHDALWHCVDAWWDRPEREFQYAAVDLLARAQRQLGPADVERMLALAQRKSWWDSVDGLAAVVGAVLRRERAGQALMDRALVHPDFWVRRVAMLHQKGWRAETDVARLWRYALTLADEPEFFIRKAIGWALRDHAWHDPGAVAEFLAAHPDRFSALTRREASKHL